LDQYNSRVVTGRAGLVHGEQWHVTGANMVWRRALVEQLGGFEAGLGLTGRGVARGDETHLQLRAYEAIPGLRVYRDPGLVVYHLTRPHMMSVVYQWRRGLRKGMDGILVSRVTPLRVRRALGVIALRTGQLAWAIGIAPLFRDRRMYPFVQNFWYERVPGILVLIGYAWSSLAQNHRAGRPAQQAGAV
jgi:hypothetical protein